MNNNTLQWFLALGAALLLTLSAVGCGKEAAPKTDTPAPVAEESTPKVTAKAVEALTNEEESALTDAFEEEAENDITDKNAAAELEKLEAEITGAP